MIWIRFGYGPFIRCKNMTKARRKATYLARLPRHKKQRGGLFKANSRFNLLEGKYAYEVVHSP